MIERNRHHDVFMVSHGMSLLRPWMIVESMKHLGQHGPACVKDARGRYVCVCGLTPVFELAVFYTALLCVFGVDFDGPGKGPSCS